MFHQKASGTTKRVKTPLRFQLEARECGAVALGIILAYYGKYVPLAELRSRCGTSRDGVRVDGIARAARSYGLTIHTYKRADIRSLPLPFIIFWNFNHFLVVEGFRGEQILVNDPSLGYRVIFPDDFAAQYSGIALTLKPDITFKKEQSPPSIILPILLRPSALLLLFLDAILVIPDIILALLLGNQLSQLVDGNRADLTVIGLVALVGAARTLLGLVKGIYIGSFKPVFPTQDLFSHLLALPMTFFSNHYNFETSHRVQLSIESTDKIIELIVAMGRVIRSIICLVLLPIVTGPFTLCIFLLTTLNVTVMAYRFKRAELLRQVSEIDNQRHWAVLSHGLSDLETLHVNNTENLFFQTIMHRQVIALNKQQQYNMVLADTVVVSLPFLNLICFLLMVGMWGAQASIFISSIVGLMFILPTCDTLIRVPALIREVQRSIEPLIEVLQTPRHTEIHVAYTAGIDLQNVTYGYADTPILHNVSLSVDPGQRIAVVGRSGSGKSSLLRLIAGLYSPWQGTIATDLEQLVLLDGEPFFFDGSLHENLDTANRSFEDIAQACQDACIESEILAFPDGYDYRFRQGQSHFSAGQLQRLEIARALVRRPAILLLDEATSMVDTQTEKQIFDNMTRRGCTCLVVSHRLSTIRHCEKVIVLDEGKIVQSDSFEALERTNGVFANLLDNGTLT